ncbi:MAG: serine/threonine-protein phosphatase [Acidobacteria bacterium]|nr:serine/threonine-protein phosphatase [Acidobacteriota bacterium]
MIDEHRLGIVIGDVSGKGIPAALYMAVTRTQIKTTALRGLSPAECLLEVNRVLMRDKVSSMFATCFYGILDLRDGALRYCNAGHNPPFIIRGDGAVERVPMTGGLPLGMFAKLKCKEGLAAVGEGESLYFYTDGVTEATDASLDDFTEARLIQALTDTTGLSGREIIDRVTRVLVTFTQEAPQSDDVTMVALRWTAELA